MTRSASAKSIVASGVIGRGWPFGGAEMCETFARTVSGDQDRGVTGVTSGPPGCSGHKINERSGKETLGM